MVDMVMGIVFIVLATFSVVAFIGCLFDWR